MKTQALWRSLQRRLTKAWQRRRPTRISVQRPAGSGDPADWATLQSVLDGVGQQLGVVFELRRDAGDVLLLDGDALTASRTVDGPAGSIGPAPAASTASYGAGRERPVVRMPALPEEAYGPLPPALRRLRLQDALLQEFRSLEPVRRSIGALRGSNLLPSPSVAATSLPWGSQGQALAERAARERLVQEQFEILRLAVQGLRQPMAPPLFASYGPGAHLHFQFKSKLVWIDPQAQQHLRVRRELPAPMPDATPRVDALLRELDETVWDLGMAGGQLPLLDAPPDWWHVPLKWRAGADAVRYTRQPSHLDMSRRLQDRALTPHELRHHARVPTQELRRFLQASLAVGLIGWASPQERRVPREGRGGGSDAGHPNAPQPMVAPALALRG